MPSGSDREARFAIAGRKAGQDLFALDARVMAENLTRGPGGWAMSASGGLGPQGLTVNAETAALSRLTGGPTMGPARITGRLTEAKPGWRFAGQAQASKLDLGSYSLAQAAGPLEVTSKAGEWGVKTRLAGSGGQGAGFVAAALGEAPKASFDGSRLADGRLAMRELRADRRGAEAGGERRPQPAGRADVQGQGGDLQPGRGAGRARRARPARPGRRPRPGPASPGR